MVTPGTPAFGKPAGTVGNLDAAEQLPPGELGAELRGIERGIDGEWDSEMHDGLAIHRHIALARRR